MVISQPTPPTNRPVVLYAGPFTVVTKDDGSCIIEITAGGKSDFDELLFRAVNCWPNAPVPVKELNDIVRHGRVLQNYNHQR